MNGGGWHGGVKFTGQDYSRTWKAADWWKQLNQPLLDMGVDFSRLIPGHAIWAVSRSMAAVRKICGGCITRHIEMTEKASGGRGFA